MLKCFPQYYGAFKKEIKGEKGAQDAEGVGIIQGQHHGKLKKQAQKERCVMFLFICKSFFFFLIIRIIKENKKVVLGTVISQCGDILSG